MSASLIGHGARDLAELLKNGGLAIPGSPSTTIGDAVLDKSNSVRRCLFLQA